MIEKVIGRVYISGVIRSPNSPFLPNRHVSNSPMDINEIHCYEIPNRHVSNSPMDINEIHCYGSPYPAKLNFDIYSREWEGDRSVSDDEKTEVKNFLLKNMRVSDIHLYDVKRSNYYPDFTFFGYHDMDDFFI